jgi:hypothetical protein
MHSIDETSEQLSACPRLERGELVHFPTAPFLLPSDDDLRFLLEQRVTGFGHKELSFDPATGRVSGVARANAEHRGRLASLLAQFSDGVTAWMQQAFPLYHAHGVRDRVAFRPEEEATRRLRQTARNDLLHLDAFPNRPSWGRRILRVFANVNPTDPRVWVTSASFAELLPRFGPAAGLPGQQLADGWLRHWGRDVLSRWRSRGRPRSPYDAFMLRFHDYLKRCDEFQERGSKRLWRFGPGSAWLAFTDACSHAELRGRFALEHSFFISPEGLTLPDEAPAVLLDRFCRQPPVARAA